MTQNKEVSIEDYMERNKVIGQFAEVEPEIEYRVGNGTGSCFHPKNCGYSWPPEQKRQCERWISEHKEYAEREGYCVQTREWWPWYNQDWNQLMKVVEKINKTNIPNNKYPASVIIFRTTTHINDDGYIIVETTGKTLFEHVYAAVYQFITWYNTTLKSRS